MRVNRYREVTDMPQDYRQVMRDVDAELRRRGGKATAAELQAACEPGTAMPMVHNCIGYLAHVKVRPEGASHFEPAIVYHHAMAPYIDDGVEPEVDKWVRSMFSQTGARTITTATLNRVGKLSGYTPAVLKQAFVRLGCRSTKVAGTWHRTAPGGEAEGSKAAKATLTADEAAEVVRAEIAGTDTDAAHERIEAHPTAAAAVLALLGEIADTHEDEPEDEPEGLTLDRIGWYLEMNKVIVSGLGETVDALHALGLVCEVRAPGETPIYKVTTAGRDYRGAGA